jgi:hypothetical protein
MWDHWCQYVASTLEHTVQWSYVSVWCSTFRYLLKTCQPKFISGSFPLALEGESGPVVGYTLVGARVLRCPHLGEHDAITAVLLVAGPGQGVSRERGPVTPWNTKLYRLSWSCEFWDQRLCSVMILCCALNRAGKLTFPSLLYMENILIQGNSFISWKGIHYRKKDFQYLLSNICLLGILNKQSAYKLKVFTKVSIKIWYSELWRRIFRYKDANVSGEPAVYIFRIEEECEGNAVIRLYWHRFRQDIDIWLLLLQ